MAEPPSVFDPFGVLRELRSRLEGGLKQLADSSVRSEGIVAGMNRALNNSLWAEKQARELQLKVLAAMNLPSRTELLSLGEKVQAVEDRVIALSVQLSRLEGGAAPGRAVPSLPSPPRTRKPAPPAAVEVAAAPAKTRRRAKR